LGSYLSGSNFNRDSDVNLGNGRNGKSTIFNALEVILGKFYGRIDKSVIVFDPKQHKAKGGGQHTSHLIPIDGKRLIVTQELMKGDTVDSEILKKLASADPKENQSNLPFQ
jgi:hypothetical protein